MDRASLLGALLGLTLLGVAIGMGPNPRIFINWHGIVVVFGGIIASTMIRFPWANVRSALMVASKAFFTRVPRSQNVVLEIVGISTRAKKEGLRNLEKYFGREPFLNHGLRMVVDQMDRDYIEGVLTREIHSTQERHNLGQEIFRFIATSAPSFGMVGTLIGMIQLFASLKEPAGLGPAMALSLTSTLYGAVMAYLVAIPIAGKLELRSREEIIAKQLMLEGVLGIQAEMNPKTLEEHLNAFLAPLARVGRSV